MTDNSIHGAKLYIDPNLSLAGRPKQIASRPVARWLGDWIADVRREADELVSAAVSQGSLAQIVIYNIPGRDSGGYAAGGAGSSASYRAWVDLLAAGVGNRRAIIILEPDALANLDALSRSDQAERLADLSYAAEVLADHTLASTYIDAGHSAWQPVSTMVDRLQKAGVDKACGFSLNVSNFQWTRDEAAYGDAIAAKLGGNRYVVDTGRNGQGPATNDWFNPPGRGLGPKPTTNPPVGKYADAYLWIKVPGESDGPTHGGPPGGQWFESYADMLIANATETI